MSDSQVEEELTNFQQHLTSSLSASPNDPVVLGTYASFLTTVPSKFTTACTHYESCLKACIDPATKEVSEIYSTPFATFSGMYASFLLGSASGSSTAIKEQADGLFSKALAVEPGNPLLFGDYATYLHRHKKDYAAADAAYRKHLGDFPGHSSIWTKYGNFLKSVKRDVAGAENAYRTAVKRSPLNTDCLSSYAVFCHGTKGDHDAAESLYERARAIASSRALANSSIWISGIPAVRSRPSVPLLVCRFPVFPVLRC